MIKNKPDFKLINTALLILIIFLMYQTGNLWIGIFSKFLTIFLPLFISFVIAYSLYPLLEFFTNHKVPKAIGVTIIIVLIMAILAFFVISVFPLLFSQLTSLFNAIITFLKDFSISHDINIGPLQTSLANIFNDIIFSLGKYVSNGAVSLINISIQFVTTGLIIFSLSAYFLIDMNKIRNRLKKYLKRKSKRSYTYISLLDNEMKNYLSGFVKLMFISLVEYTLAYAIIGHPNAVLLGFLALLSGIIPYFGGIITNILAAITAIVISPALFIKTVITFVILSVLDGNVIGPIVYGKTNQMPPLVVIMSVFAGGIIFGLLGIIISLPLAIIILTTYKYFKEDINDKIVDIKVSNKKEKSNRK